MLRRNYRGEMRLDAVEQNALQETKLASGEQFRRLGSDEVTGHAGCSHSRSPTKFPPLPFALQWCVVRHWAVAGPKARGAVISQVADYAAGIPVPWSPLT